MIKEIFRHIYNKITIPIWWKKALYVYLINRKNNRLSIYKGIQLKNFDFFVPKNKFTFFLSGYELAQKLKNTLNSKFIFNNNETVYVIINDIVHLVETYDELFILHELYIQGCYNFHLPTKKSVIVIDIGSNVGFSCLFFATKSYVKSVIGFEPIPETFKQAQKNLANNPTISDKIKIYNYGLGNKDYTTTWRYDNSKKRTSRLIQLSIYAK